MSAVWLQVGQCGNQIGQEWWQLLTQKSALQGEADRHPFCSLDGKLSAICVDSEPKVVRKLQRHVKGGFFRESNLIVGKQGRGKNWAYGYHDGHADSERSLLQRTMESLRKEAERRDCYCGTVLFHSLGGGTGAGLGSRLCEAIRDEYSLGQILAVTVAPHQAGESPLQHYNALLCLAWLQRHTDGILLLQNDEVLARAGAPHAAAAQPRVSLSSMNTYIASCLAGLLYPVEAFTGRVSIGMEPWELLRTVCPMPAMKFLYVSQASHRGTVFWDSLASSSVHYLPRESHAGQPHHSTAVLAVARSPDKDSFLRAHGSVLKRLHQACRCVPWNPFPISCWTDSHSVMEPGSHSHSLTVCTNHSSSADFLQQVAERAQVMYRAGAYLHWYWRHGCEEEDFRQAFDTLRSVTDDYGHLGE
ncbi:PREDICTED: tubulin beta chain-like [Gavialis gangeticus]|uniref:tubulin beta chain-like n=1 Tax=Gavialis gangeticus TaxID=94835 RepID=UPI00092F2A0F|nr:PREDICTED: tubulin beta chain-like [Gavialis gangeticus]